MKHLMKEEVAESRNRSRLITRANQISKKYSKMKRKTRGECPVSTKRARPVQRDDPMIPFKQLRMLRLAILKARNVMLQNQLHLYEMLYYLLELVDCDSSPSKKNKHALQMNR